MAERTSCMVAVVAMACLLGPAAALKSGFDIYSLHGVRHPSEHGFGDRSRGDKVQYEANEACGVERMGFESYVQQYGESKAYLVKPSEELQKSLFPEQAAVMMEQYADRIDMRKAVYEYNAAYVADFNCHPRGPYTLALNHLADWTPDEMKKLRGYKRKNGKWNGKTASAAVTALHAKDHPDVAVAPDMGDLPESLSWGDLSSLEKHDDQGSCGSCWAFAAEATLRARAQIANRSYDFSVAQLVSCTPNPQHCGGSGGCEGATAELAFEYALLAPMKTKKDMPYSGGTGSCPSDLKIEKPGVSMPTTNADGSETHALAEGRTAFNGMTGWTKLAENKEAPLVQALVHGGPVAVAVGAGADWSFYSHGILTKRGCDQGNVINHAVTLFGYGVAHHEKYGTIKYWRIRNSWGSYWGEKGNLRLERLEKEEEFCGWDHQPEVGSGCDGGPKQVWVCGSCGILYDTAIPSFTLQPDVSA